MKNLFRSALMIVVAHPFYRFGFHIQHRTSNRRNGPRRKPRERENTFFSRARKTVLPLRGFSPRMNT